MLTKNEQNALEALETICLWTLLHDNAKTDGPGQFVMKCPREIREQLTSYFAGDTITAAGCYDIGRLAQLVRVLW